MKKLLGLLFLCAACGSGDDDGVKLGESVSGLKLVSQDFNLDIPPIWAFCNGGPQVGPNGGVPGKYSITCEVPMVAPVLPIGMGWETATAEQNTLAWSSSKWVMELDGKAIDLESFGYFSGVQLPTPDGNHALSAWKVAIDKPTAGEHTLRWQYTIDRDIFDGFVNCPKGTYDLTYHFKLVPGM